MGDEKGIMTLPFVLGVVLLGILASGGLGWWKDWKKAVVHQREIDQCTRRVSRRMFEILKSVETNNTRMKVLRIAVSGALAAGQGALAAVSRLALKGVNLLQIQKRVEWGLEKASYLLGCGKGAYPTQMPPAFPWQSLPPDTLGPRPWIQEGSGISQFGLELRKGRRRSRVRFSRVESWNGDGQVRWSKKRTSRK